MKTTLTFGGWLKRRRGGLGLTQKELAQQVGYAEVTLRKVEADELRPSREMAEKLAEALEIAPDERAQFVRFARDEPGWDDVALPPEGLSAVLPSPPPNIPHNLPTPPTPLIGRKEEIVTVLALLRRDDVRLVTLTGAGGSGKTRLAIEAARQVYDGSRSEGLLREGRPVFADGVYFVNLAPLVDPTLVLAAIAQTLDLREQGERSLADLLKDTLRAKRLLLVLDNFEHLVEAAPLVADLLMVAPDLKVLATSRRSLRLRGEIEYAVPPLVAPKPDHVTALADLAGYEAVQLFIQRALEIKPDFAVTPENAPAVGEICHRLDGLPLALELAAARVKIFPPQTLSYHLERRLPLLTSGMRDMPQRQQTMRNTIAWSYELLAADEQKLFRRLAVFVGGYTLQAAAAVCNIDRTLAVEIVEGLAGLVDQSLLQVDMRSGESRFVMLQTLQEYALEQLEKSGEGEMLRRAYARFYLDLTQAIEPKARGVELVADFKRLQPEQDNLRAVLRWAFSGGEPVWGAQLAARLSGIWEFFGDLGEGRQWLDAALALPAQQVPDAVRADMLYSAGALAYRQGAHAVAQQLLHESLAIWQALGNKAGIAHGWHYLGHVALETGDLSSATDYFQTSLSLFRELEDPVGIAFSTGNLGNVATLKGNFQEAQTRLEEALAIFEPMHSQFHLCLVKVSLGWMATLQADWDGARRYLSESIVQLRDLGEKRFLLYGLIALIGVALGEYQPLRAARLLGIAEALRTTTHTHVMPLLGIVVEDFGARIRTALAPTEYAAALHEGQTMPLAQAIAYAATPASPAEGTVQATEGV